MEIERQWGKYPGWFSSLDRDAQVRLLAGFKIRFGEPPKGAKGGGRRR